MKSCPICEKHQTIETPLYENEYWMITPGSYDSQVLGYLYLEPKRHVENWSDLTDEELMQIGLLIKKTEGVLREVLNIDRLYSLTISEQVRHLHFHLVPRASGENTKGIPLLERATQQNTKEKITTEEYNRMLDALRENF
ncbi:HIT family protein [Rossellomorea sp. FM04394]|uniref:HIT family protein n=1 Tax=Rossellomorea sp. FM04394 TaxID=3243076 RepID=UPI0035A60726